MPARFYSNAAVPTSLTGSILASATSITVAATTGFPNRYPYTLTLSKNDPALAEAVEVTAGTGTTLTVTRGIDGTTARDHGVGALVSHDHTARDYVDIQDARDYRIMSVGAAASALKRGQVSLGTAQTTILTVPAGRKYVVKSLMLTGSENATARRTSVLVNGVAWLWQEQDVSEEDPIVYDSAIVLNAGEVLSAAAATAGVITATASYVDLLATDDPVRLAASSGFTPTTDAWTTVYTAPAAPSLGTIITHITANSTGTLGSPVRFGVRTGTTSGAFLSDSVANGGDFVNFDSPVLVAPGEVLQVRTDAAGLNFVISGLPA